MKPIYSMLIIISFLVSLLSGCADETAYDTSFQIADVVIEGGVQYDDVTFADIDATRPLRLKFTKPVDKTSVEKAISLFPVDDEENLVTCSISFEEDDKVLIIIPETPLDFFAKYNLNIWQKIYSADGVLLNTGRRYTIITGVDQTDKFPRITDDELLDKVQQQTFRYFWNHAHPVSGMARERDNSGDVVTTGGTGFGIMAMIVAAERNFITRDEAYQRILKITSFLHTCPTYHGAFSHWINGATGATVPFSPTDDGADLVETSFLMQGLLTARQYFDKSSEAALRSSITTLWEAVDWTWFNRDNVLFWNWSPNFGWDINLGIRGWNEALITYVLAAASPTHSISKTVYDKGWTRNGNMVNGESFYDIELPLGENYGGPLFFSHYSFLGLNPNNLKDGYVNNYWTQVQNHALIHHAYCVANPKRYVGYSSSCWGLTASDGDKGYSAHSPENDLGVIAPTAALASMPYTPMESMEALHYYYYKLGNHLWKEDGYGFYDAFNLSARWFDNQYLAIDQGPIIIMIENHRSGLLWELFMQIQEVKDGLQKLGFSSPYIN